MAEAAGAAPDVAMALEPVANVTLTDPPEAEVKSGVADGITLQPQAEFDPSGWGAMAHFKGFAARVDFTDAATAQAELACAKFVQEQGIETIIWDGDDLESGSFTTTILKLVELCKVRLVAFLREEDVARFKKSWASSNLPISVFLVSNEVNWQKLGEVALQQTGAKQVVCLGGGPTLKSEYEHCPEGVVFHVACITRPAADASLPWQATSIADLVTAGGSANLASLL